MSILEIRDLTKSYTSPDGEEVSIIDIAEFSLEEGKQVALRGSSGSGKTTFLNLIAGILRSDSGTVEVAGKNLSNMAEANRDLFRARNLGYIFQTFNLLQAFTGLENVLLGMMFGAGKDEARARDLLDRVGLGDRMSYQPGQMSVGQQQRVAIARALANRPCLVLADEPTGNLDAAHGQESLSLIREVCEENNAALLLVSHDRDIIGQFDHVMDLAEINQAASAQSEGGGG
ncbi:MAG: ABC transporter ATP-binding protein [Planctomycetota bacterium]|jgi:putative ABC transport system ATP-binding protein|nr:ABC transporter ATP-binding protein [Planctomycetota bacterium]MDP7250785.1 ABC transporter ATP-binding protein [Planctomycetota bacterium]